MNNIALSKINLNAPTQLRLMENQAHIEELAHVYADKGQYAELPWVALVKETGEYVPIDGFHRLLAVEWLQTQKDIVTAANLENVAIRYSEFDTMADAIVAAAGVNSTHGLKRKRGDIQNAIRAILKVDAHRFMVSKFKLNKKAIMEAVNCSARSYDNETSAIKKELETERNVAIDLLALEGLSQREIADRTGVPQPTINRVLGDSKTQDAQMNHSKSNQQEPQNETDTAIPTDTDTPEQDTSVFTHITSVTPVECPWDDEEEDQDGDSQEAPNATTPSFSGSKGSETTAKAPLENPKGISDTDLIKFLHGLSDSQQDLARKVLDLV